MDNMVGTCSKYVDGMIELGEAFTEVEVQLFIVSRYAKGKAEWIKWKKMLNKISKSDMKYNTLVEMALYPIFEEGGLFDQGTDWAKAELENVKSKVRSSHLWDMNMHRPSSCYESYCPAVLGWIKSTGVSEDAADLHNFKVRDESNVTLDEIDTQLDYFKEYENELEN
jgi:hypothetical protein